MYRFKKEITDKNKVLLACPTSEKKAYIQEAWLKHLSKLSYPNLDILIVDNSETIDNSKKIESYGIKNLKVIWVGDKIDFKKDSLRLIMTRCTNLIFKYFLKRNYSHWVSLESDNFPPLNFIEHLMAQNKSCAGLSYFHGGGIQLSHTIMHRITKTGHCIDLKCKETYYEVTGGFIPVYQCGIGCMLVKRNVIKKIPKLEYFDSAVGLFPDAFFLDELYQKFNYFPYIDTRHYCIHYNNDKIWEGIHNSTNV